MERTRIVSVGGRGRNIRRLLDPRIGCSSKRCSEDLLDYSERIFQRLGLSDGECWIKLCRYTPSVVGFLSEVAFSGGAQPPEPPPGKGTDTGADPPAAQHPKMISWLLWNRFRRLLKYSSLKFGHIRFVIKGGKIDEVRWTHSIRPRLDGSGALGGMFTGAPASQLWSRAKPVGP